MFWQLGLKRPRQLCHIVCPLAVGRIAVTTRGAETALYWSGNLLDGVWGRATGQRASLSAEEMVDQLTATSHPVFHRISFHGRRTETCCSRDHQGYCQKSSTHRTRRVCSPRATRRSSTSLVRPVGVDLLCNIYVLRPSLLLRRCTHARLRRPRSASVPCMYRTASCMASLARRRRRRAAGRAIAPREPRGIGIG